MVENLNKLTFSGYGRVLRDSLPNRGFPSGAQWQESVQYFSAEGLCFYRQSAGPVYLDFELGMTVLAVRREGETAYFYLDKPVCLPVGREFAILPYQTECSVRLAQPAGAQLEVLEPVTAAENLKLGDRLREELCDLPDGTVCFRLGENERCPFLDDDNLCELILKLGDDALCEICREHPRFYEELGGRVEMGVGLCCEEACRLLFEQKNPVTFITTNVGELPNAPEDPLVFHLRDEAFAIVQDRSLPLRVRMHRLLDFGVQAQKTLFGNMSPAERDTTDETDTRAALFDMMTEMEPYDETWPDYVQLLEDNGLQANLDDMDGGYENLLVYFLYRHFAHGVTDGRIAARVGFCAVSVWFICLMNTKCLRDTGEFTPWDRIVCTKDYSKQVEYSAENMEMALDALHKDPIFSAEHLKRLFG